MNRRKIGWLVLFLALFGVLGYLREFFFLNMNNILYLKYYQRESTMPVPAVMSVFLKYSYAQLYYSKYLFTALWTGVFLAANYFALVRLTANRYLVRLLLISYALLVSVAAVAMLYNYFVKSSYTGDEYTLSRWLMGVAQSPLICLILLASERLYKTTITHDQQGQKDI